MVVKFSYTCPRHQQMFIEAARRGGCRDPDELDAARRRTLAWFSVKFPRMVLDHFNEDSCRVCKLETNGVGLDEIEHVVIELAPHQRPTFGVPPRAVHDHRGSVNRAR